VPNESKKLLEQINEVSRQILSHVLAVQNTVRNNTTMVNELEGEEPDSDEFMSEYALTELMSKRESLIHSLFKQKNEEVAHEQDLLNEMLLLDSDLLNKSQACKETLAGQVIRLKKSKKVSKSYQKY
jgi:hypothetical protein